MYMFLFNHIVGKKRWGLFIWELQSFVSMVTEEHPEGCLDPWKPA